MSNRWRQWRGTFRLIVGICAALGWWGILYPELTMVSDTYRIVIYDENTDEMRIVEPGEYKGDSIYYEILEADQDQIIYKSKLLEEMRKKFSK